MGALGDKITTVEGSAEPTNFHTRGRRRRRRLMKRRRSAGATTSDEWTADVGDLALDTGARHFRDTKQVKNDVKAIQEKTLTMLMSGDQEADEAARQAEDPFIVALLDLGFDKDETEELKWKTKNVQCSLCLAGGGEEAVAALECTYCQRDVCLDCIERCEKCLQSFCRTCTTINHEQRHDRKFCLTCNTEDIKEQLRKRNATTFVTLTRGPQPS